MRADREIAQRMRDMLTFDKVNVKEGFLAALNGDLTKLFADYFVPSGEVCVEIAQRQNGAYEVTVTLEASRIKQFDTTKDVKRY